MRQGKKGRRPRVLATPSPFQHRDSEFELNLKRLSLRARIDSQSYSSGKQSVRSISTEIQCLSHHVVTIDTRTMWEPDMR